MSKNNGHANGRLLRAAPGRSPRRTKVTPARPHSPVNVAVVGLGYWGPNLVRNLHELDATEITVVSDLRPEACESIQRRYPCIEARADYADVLADPTVEAVAIATPVGTHHALASAALEAGKHVFVEKPLAASVEEAPALVELAERRAAC